MSHLAHDGDDLDRLRFDRKDEDEQATRDLDQPAQGSPSFVAKTKSLGSYPTAAGKFYACETQGVFGAEVENGAGSLTAQGDTLFAYNLGTVVPPQGTPVVITYVFYRWVFRYDG